MPQLQPPETVLEIAADLERAGFEAWCVGGAIRDALLGHPDLDWDLATSAKPAEVRQIFGHRRTIPVGIDFGTVGVLDRHGVMHEVTTFRRDVRTDGRHAEVEFGVSLEDDLARRDFTINAIAYSPRLDEIRDPFDGRADLARRVVRAVGDAEARMREDRLRALRRFGSPRGSISTIEPATRRAIETSAPMLDRLSRERVKQELDKTMEQVRRPSGALATWRDVGAFRDAHPCAGHSAYGIAGDPRLSRDAGPRRPTGAPSDSVRRIVRVAHVAARRPTCSRVCERRATRSSWCRRCWIAGDASGRQCPKRSRPGLPTDAQVRRWVAAIGRLKVGPFMRLASGCWAAAQAAGTTSPAPDAVRSLCTDGCLRARSATRSTSARWRSTATTCGAPASPRVPPSVEFFRPCWPR